MSGVIGVLFTCGTYLILKPNLIRLVMGFGIYSNAVNLLLITTGGYTRTKDAPFIEAASGLHHQGRIGSVNGDLVRLLAGLEAESSPGPDCHLVNRVVTALRRRSVSGVIIKTIGKNVK